jgi:formamidopyrimidine-DNA glycosylase
MPELPEVETIAADLRPHLVGRTIVKCELLFPTIVRHPEPEVFIDSVVGQKVTSVGRRGKYILIRLVDDLVLVVHLGMSGQLRIVAPSTPLANHTHAVLDLDDGRQLRYVDPRRFGRLLLGSEAALREAKAMPSLGPEPIDPGFGADDMYQRFRRRKAKLKAILLDQSTIAGVGNIYADESLHRAGLRPRRHRGTDSSSATR